METWPSKAAQRHGRGDWNCSTSLSVLKSLREHLATVSISGHLKCLELSLVLPGTLRKYPCIQDNLPSHSLPSSHEEEAQNGKLHQVNNPRWYQAQSHFAFAAMCLSSLHTLNKMKIFRMQQLQPNNLVVLSRKPKQDLDEDRLERLGLGGQAGTVSPFWSLCPGMQATKNTHCPLTLLHSHLPSNCDNTVSKCHHCLKQALEKEQR